MHIWIERKILSDSSPVFDVIVGEERIACESQKQAELLADKLKETIDNHSLAHVTTEYNY